MTMPTHGNLTAYARRRGITQQAASQFKAAGRLVLEEVDGWLLVNFEASDARIAATADPANVGRGENARRRHRAAAPGRRIEPIDPALARVMAAYGQARAVSMAHKAKMAELEYRVSIGELIPAEATAHAVGAAFRSVRDALLRIPRRVAGQVAGASTAVDVEQLLQVELDAAMGGFVDPIPSLVRREKPMGGA